MSKLKIYGIAQSRAARTLWMVEECGVPYEHIKTHFAKDTKNDAFKAINPNARVPVIDDDGVIVWESMAINLYLAKKYGGDASAEESRRRSARDSVELLGDDRDREAAAERAVRAHRHDGQ